MERGKLEKRNEEDVKLIRQLASHINQLKPEIAELMSQKQELIRQLASDSTSNEEAIVEDIFREAFKSLWRSSSSSSTSSEDFKGGDVFVDSRAMELLLSRLDWGEDVPDLVALARAFKPSVPQNERAVTSVSGPTPLPSSFVNSGTGGSSGGQQYFLDHSLQTGWSTSLSQQDAAQPYHQQALGQQQPPQHHQPVPFSCSPSKPSSTLSTTPPKPGLAPPHQQHQQSFKSPSPVPHQGTPVAGCSFYWGSISREDANNLLKGAADGTFLLRDSFRDPQIPYALHVQFHGQSRPIQVSGSGQRVSRDLSLA